MHDVLAELAAYRDELDNAQRRGRDDRAAAVREEIDRVKAEVTSRAEAAEARAVAHKEAGQDVVAAHHEVEARRYRDALADPAGGPEAAVSNAPRERATPRKARS